MFHPSRGGVRGGQDQFSWDNVKEDKHRENYLGHSLKAPVGRWQKGKDLTWYAKDDKSMQEAREKEIKAIKDAEEEAMLEALGYPVKKKTNLNSQIDAKELQNVLQKGNMENEVEGNGQAVYEIKGLGFKDSHSKSLTGKTEITKFTSISTLNNPQQALDNIPSSIQPDNQSEKNSPPIKTSHSKHKSKKKEKKSKSKHKHKVKKHKYNSDSESGDERHDSSRHALSSRYSHKDYDSKAQRKSRSPSRYENKRNEIAKHSRDEELNSSYRRESSPTSRYQHSQHRRSRRYSRSRSPARRSSDHRSERR